MKYSVPVKNSEELEIAMASGADEVLISPKELSRFGTLSFSESQSLAGHCREKKIKSVLEWDALFTETRFQAITFLLDHFEFELFDEVRVQDPGVFVYCLENTNLPIQLNLETGNHNFESVKAWSEYGKDRISKLILSPEIPGDKVKSYRRKLGVPVELMGVGKILLFYTPRELLSPYLEPGSGEVNISASSQESPHSGFQVIQNIHGTFMWGPKDQFLLDSMPALVDAGVDWLRMDLRFYDMKVFMPLIVQALKREDGDCSLLKKQWPCKIFGGFFRVNKTDTLFKKLKNKKLERNDENYLGVVLDVVKKERMGLMLKAKGRTLAIGDMLEIHTPEGKIKSHLVEEMRNSRGELIREASSGQIVFTKHVSGVSIRSALYILPRASWKNQNY